MAKSLPPLTWFRSFEAAARTLSSTAAAHEIGLTQSAVSQQIRALETRLGVMLFRRHARGLSLTDDGRKLLPQVEAALETLELATLPYLTGASEGLVTVAASLSIIEWVMSPALPTFNACHPGITLRFVSTIWPDEFAALRADVEVRFGSQRQVGKDATLLRPNHLIAVKAPHLKNALEDLPLIEAVGTSDGWPAWGQGAGFAHLNPTYLVDSYGVSLTLAQHGNGAALVSSVIANRALQSGTVVPAHPHSCDATEGYHLSINRNSANAEAFADWLLDNLPQDN